MRLTCPNCAAQYQIDDALIPDGGREVQCSNCGHTWFEDRPDSDAVAADAAGANDAPERPRRRELDESTRRILREEAELEAAQRQRAAEAPIEEQTELGLDPPPREKRKGLADLPDRDLETSQGGAGEKGRKPHQRPGDTVGDSTAAMAASSRGDLLPDIEQINSTLTATSERQRGVPDDADDAASTDTMRNGGGFRAGFLLVLLLTVLALVTYVTAPQIAEAVPRFEPQMAAYVQAVNEFRATVDEWLIAASQAIVGATGGD